MYTQFWEFLKDNWIYLTLIFIAWAFLVGVTSSRTVIKTIISSNPYKKGAIFYYLPESLIRIKASAKVAVVYNATDNTLTDFSKVLEQTFACTTEIISDNKHLLSLQHEENGLMSDEIKFGVSSNGLLETVNITTDDRTAEVVSRLAAAPATVLSPASSIGTGKRESTKIQRSTAEFVIKASEAHDKTINWNIIIANEYAPEEIKIVKGDFKITSSEIKKFSPDLSELIKTNNVTGKEFMIEGILTRPVKSIQLDIGAVDEEESIPPVSVFVSVVDTSQVYNVQIERTPFVKRINNISIQDGIVITNEINHPSIVEGFLSIPINILKAIVSIPAQLFTLRYDNTIKKANKSEEAPPLRF